jgi:hypothetical protein
LLLNLPGRATAQDQMKTKHGIATPKSGNEPIVQSEEVSVADWKAMSKALRELHRVLLDMARRNYERDHGPISNPAHFLQLLTGDEYFAWLRPLSGLMADIDHIAGLDAGSRSEVAEAVRAAVEGLIAPAGQAPAEAFATNYLPLLAHQPEVVMAHAQVRQAARRWPAPDKVEGADHLRERGRVAEMAKRRKAAGS